MGYGEYSSEFVYIPRSVPEKPTNGPRNTESTTQTVLDIEFDRVIEDGGEEISQYNIYVDDGLDGDFGGPYTVKNALTWNSQGTLNSLVTGRQYRVKYSSSNIHGESSLSDETVILLAIAPTMPSNLARIDEKIL